MNHQWFSLLGEAIRNELNGITSGNHTPFTLEQLLFIPQTSVEQTENSLLYLTFLLDHLLHATINLTCLNRTTFAGE